MANTFLSNLVPNVGPQSGSPLAGTTIIPAIPATQVAIIFGLSGTNLLTTPILATFYIRRANANVNVLYQATVPVGSSIVVAGNDQKIVLQAGDALVAYSSASSGLDVLCSYLIQS